MAHHDGSLITWWAPFEASLAELRATLLATAATLVAVAPVGVPLHELVNAARAAQAGDEDAEVGTVAVRSVLEERGITRV